MQLKKCCNCQVSKPISLFGKNKNGIPFGPCEDCIKNELLTGKEINPRIKQIIITSEIGLTICRKCNCKKPNSEFYFHSKKNVLERICKDCKKELEKLNKLKKNAEYKRKVSKNSERLVLAIDFIHTLPLSILQQIGNEILSFSKSSVIIDTVFYQIIQTIKFKFSVTESNDFFIDQFKNEIIKRYCE